MDRFPDFENYIFDLYGTLIDVHTDERRHGFWTDMAKWYSAHGADYDPEDLGEKYRATVAEEERELGKKTGRAFPEIELAPVFLRLLDEAPLKRDSALAPSEADRERWAKDTANLFRLLSRDRLEPYPGAAELLSALRERGRKVYLLSNAQSVFTVPEIEMCGLAELFDGIWLSSDKGVKKPEPSFLKDLLGATLSDPERTVMVGNDWYADMGIAASCGVWGMWVNSDKRNTVEREASRNYIAGLFGPAAAGRILEAESIEELLKQTRQVPLPCLASDVKGSE